MRLQLLEQIKSKRTHADVPVVMIFKGTGNIETAGFAADSRRPASDSIETPFKVRTAHSGGEAGAGDSSLETRSAGTSSNERHATSKASLDGLRLK